MGVVPVVRRAVPGDAEAAAYCHAACWREAYADLIDPATLEEATRDIARRINAWRSMLGEGRETWIALSPDADVPVGERVIGFAQPGSARDVVPAMTLELYAIYVRRAWWGSGVADRLMDVAVGDEPASLWVFEANARARAFYARHGFRPDGARVDEPRFGLPEIRMVRR